ncbi:MAG: restriction endonuclease subunit S [Burkholderiaceae bacterium]|nr:restriction endonuclease subunit S [Burkholderiaceae bacterium]
MAGEWRQASIGALCDAGVAELQTGPFGTQLHAYDYVDVGVPVVPTEAIRGRQIDHAVLPKITQAKAQELERHRLRPGDILFARRGVQATGHIGCVRAAEDGFICGTGAIRLRVTRATDEIDPNYLSHVLADPASVEWFKFHAIGATMPNLNEGIIRSFPLSVPPFTEQRAIAHILGTLDDKIELNRRMNETLEAMARALFKSWFVDFDPVRAKAEGRDPGLPKPLADLFPDRFVESEVGEIPEGWEVQSVGDHVVNFDSKRVPVSGADRSERQGPYPYHGAAGVMDYMDDYLFDGIHLLVGEDGSVVQNNGTAVRQYVWGKIWVNNHAHVLQGKGAVSTEQLYLYFHFEPVAPYVTGAVQPKLSQGRMNTMPFVYAREGLCRAFERTIQPWFAKLRASVGETKTLAVLRDALLPKLISGELKVAQFTNGPSHE